MVYKVAGTIVIDDSRQIINTGNLTASGTITAVNFSGNGSALTGISGSVINNGTRVSVTASTSTTTLNLSSGHVQNVSLSTDTALSFSNVPNVVNVILIVSYNSYSVIWPTNIVWASNTPPSTVPQGGRDVLVSLLTYNGGLTWRGVVEFTKLFDPDTITPTGQLFAWGNNSNGILGLGDTANRSSPVQIGTDTNWKQVRSSSGGQLATKSDGTLWAWGRNDYGQLGLNDKIHRSSPVQVGSLTTWSKLRNNVEYNGYTMINGAIQTDGTFWVWGDNNLGKLGLGDVLHRSSPVQLGSGTWSNFSSSGSDSHFCHAVDTSGKLYAWGANYFGGQGTGDAVHRSSPVQVGTLTNWKQVTGSIYGVNAVKTDGSLWGWGANYYGMTFLSSSLGKLSSPVQVGTDTNWKGVYGEYETSYALKTDGTAWFSGRNQKGQGGINSTVDYNSSPIQIGTLSNWKIIEGGGDGYAFLIDSSGRLYGMGQNTNGELGLGDAVNRSSPTQISGTWNNVFGARNHSFGLK